MARKNPAQFVKRQKEMERAQKARDKMAKRHHDKEGDGITENSTTNTEEGTSSSES
ncbi:hypothetical protein SAMN04489760_11575 [Syntrophus gentianae]|uniref:Uncharacterized protein n=1 Tax=Syntrophus gentianae TaxID=43775 RepID=A0A1H7YCT0_9BACT|nr:hypothetical protein [Syntrophus gentianae]SEM43773.1 hypothetical protein SAMN04489760_11575 [Syntrophus gentianae]